MLQGFDLVEVRRVELIYVCISEYKNAVKSTFNGQSIGYCPSDMDLSSPKSAP